MGKESEQTVLQRRTYKWQISTQRDAQYQGTTNQNRRQAFTAAHPRDRTRLQP